VGQLRVVHYLNQFFGRIGAEEAGDHPFTVKEGPVGPGAGLQKELGDAGAVVATLICGDNRASTDLAAFGAEVESALRDQRADVLVAGPGFNAGRYGLACGEACARAAAIGIPAVTALNSENPGVDLYRKKTYILPTTPTAVGMNETLGRLARFAIRIGRREAIGSAAVEGYYGSGAHRTRILERPAADRALDMLLARVSGEKFQTELVLPAVDRVAPAAPIADVTKARLAIVTTGGIVPKGNPDGLKQSNSTEWKAYSIEGVESLEAGKYESIHSGYDASAANSNPNYVVPLDALRELERSRAFGELHPRYIVTTGVGTAVVEARRMGREIAAELKTQGIDGVILTAT
jgi:glycine reductase complex component B subunit gamma